LGTTQGGTGALGAKEVPALLSLLFLRLLLGLGLWLWLLRRHAAGFVTSTLTPSANNLSKRKEGKG
jgi:hypothetical protein